MDANVIVLKNDKPIDVASYGCRDTLEANEIAGWLEANGIAFERITADECNAKIVAVMKAGRAT